MVEISRDGKRVYWTNSLYSTWIIYSIQTYQAWRSWPMQRERRPRSGQDYGVLPDGYRAHQIRLEGGDCSTDSFCYPSV